ncbi:MAG: hypothetical protein C4321_10890, partial [Chloroflexota bacterium]
MERRPIDQFKAQQTDLQTRIVAYQNANLRLLAFKDAASDLASATFFRGSTATISDTAVATVTAEPGASEGDYSVTVSRLARADQKVSQSFTDLDTTTIGTGTVTITSGGATTSITIDSTNNTLSGLRDAINRAKSNIRASIVQDGDASYRLMIAARNTGTANALTINSTLAGGTTPTFTTLQSAQDAEVTLGSGADAITVTRSTNSVRDLIPGVTLNLLTAAPNAPITVSVSQDTGKIKDAVQKFVEQYNNVVDFLNEQSKYDPDSEKGGTLLGDFT